MNTVEKMAMKTADGVAANVAALKELFPEVVSEGKVDFDALKTLMGGDVAGDERYQFTWAGKRAAMIEAAKPITKTLRPCPEESKDWDTTKNIYIEGDNLDALKILQNTYAGKVKMIYIDPPYNTGHDFIYHDNFHGTKQEELIKEGAVDDETGERFKVNSESNGYFHSDWCSMMYPRLKLARQLLRDDGVIFISIDDNEVENLRKLCDEVFGEVNFVCSFAWQKRYSPPPDTKEVGYTHETILLYRRSELFKMGLLPFGEEQVARYQNPDNDPRGPWKAADYTCRYTSAERPSLYYAIRNPNTGKVIFPKKTRVWANSPESHSINEKEGRLWWGVNGDNEVPALKNYLSEIKQGSMPTTLLLHKDVGHTDEATKELRDLIPEIKFTPKPTRLIRTLVKIAPVMDADIVLDFFSGSATTAHAVMQLNAEDGGNRKFIMVQLPEICPEDCEAAKAGFKNICEIGKERIRRAGAKILEELKGKSEKGKSGAQGELALESADATERVPPDVGFRVFKIDSSNMTDVFYSPKEVKQGDLLASVDHIKPDRKPIDLLYGCLVDWGLPIDLPHEAKTINGHEVFSVGGGVLMVCFDDNVDDAMVKAIAKEKPLHVLFRDTSFATSAVKINVGEIFKALSPETNIRVL